MPRPRFARLSAARQKEILDTAAREFAQHGYDGASLNHILAAAGLSKGAAYYYFDDKADLFVTVVRRLFDHVLMPLLAAAEKLDATSFWPSLMTMAVHANELMQRDPSAAGVARAVWKLPAGARTGGPLAPLIDDFRAPMTRLLRRGRALGVVRSDLPEDLLIALVLAVDEAGDRWMGEHIDDLSPAEARRLTTALFLNLRRLLEPQPEGRT